MDANAPEKPVIPRKPWLGLAGLLLALTPAAVLAMVFVFQPG